LKVLSMSYTTPTNRRPYHRRKPAIPAVDPFTEKEKLQIASMLANKETMVAIARKFKTTVHYVRKLSKELKANKQDAPIEQETVMQSAPKPNAPAKFVRDRRHEAEMYVLSRLGKCTDEFAEVEAEFYRYCSSTPDVSRKPTPAFKLGMAINATSRNEMPIAKMNRWSK
jgi:hypothetical protein